MSGIVLVEKLITGRTAHKDAPSKPVSTSRNGRFVYGMVGDGFGIAVSDLVDGVNSVPGRIGRDGKEFKYNEQSLMSGLFVRSWLNSQWGFAAIAWRDSQGVLRLGAIPATGDITKDKTALIRAVEEWTARNGQSKPKAKKA